VLGAVAPIHRAAGVSIAAHLALLLIAGTVPIPVEEPVPPSLRLWIEQPADIEVEHRERADVRSAPRPVEAPVGVPLTSRRVDADFELAPPAESPMPLPVESGIVTDIDLPPLEGAPDALVAEPEAVVSRSDQPFEVPATLEPDPQPMPERERHRIAKRVKAWARDFRDADLDRERLVWSERGRRYTARLEWMPAKDSMALDEVVVIVTTERDGEPLESRLSMKRLAFSHFTQLVDEWDSLVMLHDDEIHGRFHSNTEFHVGSSREATPRFLAEVTTAAGSYSVHGESSAPQRRRMFPGGLDLRAPHIALPRYHAPRTGSLSAGESDVRTFEGATEVVFHGDGSYEWRAAGNPGSAARREPHADRPLFLLGKPGSRFEVRGTVRGTVLVYSPERITITGDLTYADGADSAGDAPDYLGLVSDADIVVAEPSVTGPGDLEVHGALYARRRFHVRDAGAGAGGGTLSIYGSLSAGTVSATEPRYATRIEFDPRFERARPPGFPMTNRYELVEWNGRWEPAQRN
jgi:hypothetical protein